MANARKKSSSSPKLKGLSKCPSGIAGLDQVIESKRKAMQAQVVELQAAFEAELREMEMAVSEAAHNAQSQLAGRDEMAGKQGAAATTSRSKRKGAREWA